MKANFFPLLSANSRSISLFSLGSLYRVQDKHIFFLRWSMFRISLLTVGRSVWVYRFGRWCVYPLLLCSCIGSTGQRIKQVWTSMSGGKNLQKKSQSWHVLIEFVPFTFTLYGQPISVENVLCAVVFLLLILFPIVQSTFLPLVGVFFSMMAQEKERERRTFDALLGQRYFWPDRVSSLLVFLLDWGCISCPLPK